MRKHLRYLALLMALVFLLSCALSACGGNEEENGEGNAAGENTEGENNGDGNADTGNTEGDHAEDETDNDNRVPISDLMNGLE